MPRIYFTIKQLMIETLWRLNCSVIIDRSQWNSDNFHVKIKMIDFILTNERLKSVSFQDDLAVFNLIRYFKTLLPLPLQPQNSWSLAFT